MKKPTPIKALFVDIGGVLLTNGWDHLARREAATQFHLDWPGMEERHRLNFATFEEGKLTLEDYLSRVVFHEPRAFTRARFRRFMFAQSKPFPETIDLVRQLKARHGLKIIVVSNEGRELNEHRIRTFKLAALVDAFVSSCFVHLRKPDAEIFRLALDLAQTPPEQIVFLDNTALFVQVAAKLGIRGIVHTDVEDTGKKLAALGLNCPAPVGGRR
jgi:putative hydrolase of the HAD superfamily